VRQDLAVLNDYRLALARTFSLPEVMEIRAKAEALRKYALEVHDLSAGLRAGALRIRAERRAGEILLGLKGGGLLRKGQHSRPGKPTLARLGTTQRESHVWQKIAQVPEPSFEEILSQMSKIPSRFTTRSFLRLAFPGYGSPRTTTGVTTRIVRLLADLRYQDAVRVLFEVKKELDQRTSG
jgi:hypothetical protein